jgi:UDP:flavonoid glycosyltransferase YjiC (YdhE family)
VRVLLACHDAGGTVPPVLAIAEACVARGHHVTVLSQPSVRERAEALDCSFIAFSTVPDYDRTTPLEEQLAVTLPAIVGRLVGDDLLGIDADVAVVDANLAGALAAAESRAVPSVVLLHSMYRTFVDTWFGELWPFFEAPINETRAAFGLGRVDGWPSVFAGHDRILSVVPHVFDAPAADVPATVLHRGFLVPSADAADTGPTVLIASSTGQQGQARHLQAAVDAVASLGVDAVVTTAGLADGLRAPPAVTLADFVPHASLLPHCAAMVTHAGLGSVAAALHHGVPLVCTPISRDQPLNASRVAALGAGIALDVDAHADAIATALRLVLDEPGYREAAASIAAASRDEGGADAVVTDLERLR